MSISSQPIASGGLESPRNLASLELAPLPSLDGLLAAELASALEQMAHQWRSGNSKSAEQCLAEHPELKADPEAAIRIIYEEYCLREERGQRMDTSEILRRFPQWNDALAVLLDCHRLLHDQHQPLNFPSAGQALGELRLLVELGRGALGRVFLATQPSLSDRPLVVKFSQRSGQEHLSLARLQHTAYCAAVFSAGFSRRSFARLVHAIHGGRNVVGNSAIASWEANFPTQRPTHCRLPEANSAAGIGQPGRERSCHRILNAFHLCRSRLLDRYVFGRCIELCSSTRAGAFRY